MDDRTRSFLRSNFRRYYRDIGENRSTVTLKGTSDVVPEFMDIESFEFGFIGFDKPFPRETVMRRHISFKERVQLFDYLVRNGPVHVYFSSAFYENPDARKMGDKGWKGANLVFDLDMDHLKDEPETYEDKLNAIKKETIMLVEEFLMEDFGVSLKDLVIVFSGGRGYHVHVKDEDFLELEGKERREIVDYVKGNLSPEVYLRKEKEGLRIPYRGKSGWGDRLNRSLEQLVKDLREKSDPRKFLEDVAEKNGLDLDIGEKITRKVVEIDLEKLRKGFFDPPMFPRKLLKAFIREAGLKAGVEIDEPVSCDIHRLIRLPGSLHGGGGLQVKPLSLSELKRFSPLDDAVVFNRDSVVVEATEDCCFSLKGEKFCLKEEEEKVLPRFAAVFKALRGGVEVK